MGVRYSVFGSAHNRTPNTEHRTLFRRRNRMIRGWIPLLVISCVGTVSLDSAYGAPGGAAEISPSATANAGGLPTSNEAEDQYLFATELFGKKMYELAV